LKWAWARLEISEAQAWGSSLGFDFPVLVCRVSTKWLVMYYLAQEKLKKEQVYGPNVFASSQLSIQGNASATEPTSMLPLFLHTSIPVQLSPHKKDMKVDYGVALLYYSGEIPPMGNAI